MVELVFIVCLSADSATCERRAMQFTDITTTACVTEAQPELARWVGEHPGWRVQRWTCQPIGLGQDV